LVVLLEEPFDDVVELLAELLGVLELQAARARPVTAITETRASSRRAVGTPEVTPIESS
jgi:hypothetical protein